MASLPTSAYCGDTIVFTESYASGSTGKVYLRHVDSGKVVEIAPSISGTTWTITVAPIDTAGAPAGIYSVKAVTELSGVRETKDIGSITLLAPIDRPATASHIRKMVEMLESHLEGRISDDNGRGLESYTIGGVPITKLSFADARMLLEKYRNDLKAEVTAERAALGLGTGRRVLLSFES
jgi:hypothetical protein